MFSVKYSKFYSLAFLIIIILSSFFLLSHMIENRPEMNKGMSYWLALFIPLVLIILSTIAYFVLVYILNNKLIITEDYYNEIIDAKNNEIETYISTKINKEQASMSVEVKAREQEEAIRKILSLSSEGCKTDSEMYEKALIQMGKLVDVVQAVAFSKKKDKEEFSFIASYAFLSERVPASFNPGEGIHGQVVKDKKILVLKDLPSNYIVLSGLGKSSPRNMVVVPVIKENSSIGLLEFAMFKEPTEDMLVLFEKLANQLAENLPILATKTKKSDEV